MASLKSTNYTTLNESNFKWPHIFAQWLSIRILDVMFRFKYDFKVFGKENQPKKWSSFIVASNHSSTMDPPFVSVAMDFQPISYMAKIELFQKPIMRTYNLAMSSFAVNREKLELSTVKTAIKVLKQGQWALGIFPEGTRNPDGSVGEAKRGVAYFSKTTGAPVQPIGIYKNGRRVYIHIGAMIPSEKDLDALTLKIQNSIAALVSLGKEKDARFEVLTDIPSVRH